MFVYLYTALVGIYYRYVLFKKLYIVLCQAGHLCGTLY